MSVKLHFLIFGLACFFQVSGLAQDDLEQRVRAMPDDTAKVNYIHKLVDSLRERSSRQALFFAIEGKSIADRLGYKRGSIYMLESISWMHYRNNDLLNALEATQAALKIAKEINEKPAIAKCLVTIAAIYFEERRFDKAIENFKAAAVISGESGNLSTYGRSMNNIGFSYIQLGEYDSARIYSNKSYAVAQEIGDPYIQGFSLRNFGEIATAQKKYPEAIKYYEEGLALAEKSSNNYLKISLQYRLGGVYNLLKQPRKAIPILKEAIAIGEEQGYKDELERALKLVAESFIQLKEYLTAYQYQSQYIKLHDSLETHKKEEQLSVAQAKFDSELKQTQIEVLTREASLQQEAYNRQRLFTYSTIGFAILLLILMFLLWRNNERILAAKKIVDARNNEIKQQAMLLGASNATKDKLFSIISHDLRSPIGGLKSLMELISRHGLTQEEFVRVSQSLRKNIDSVYDDLDNLLQWAQTQLNGMKSQKEMFSLYQLANDKLHLFEEVAKSKGVALHNELEDDFMLFADKNQMGLVIRNLLANAVKFSSMGGQIEVRGRREAHTVTVDVVDGGVGISALDIDKLFKTDTHFTKRGTQNEKGIGLGLILTKEFVEANDGTISVRSEVGKGSIFSIVLKGQPMYKAEPSLVA